MSTFSGDQWQRLEARLLAVMAEDAPGWTDQSVGDPGITIVELFAFLGEQLMYRAHTLPDQTRARLFDVATRLESISTNSGGPNVRVCVEGEEWHQTGALAHAGPDDRVFIVTDHQVVLGDGEHGRVPASGSSVFVSYRRAAGESGDVRVSVTTRWPPTPFRSAVVIDREHAIRFPQVEASVEQFAGDKRIRFFDGQLLSAADFRDEQQYWLARHRGHNQMLHGFGVVTGLTVNAGDSSQRTIIVQPGVAIDKVGREIIVPGPVTLTPGATTAQFVVVTYAERQTDPVPFPSSGETTASRIEEGMAVILTDQQNDDEGVAIGRVVPTPAGWQLDATFVPRTLGRNEGHRER